MRKYSNIKIIKKGFTLLEVMVAIFVITVGIMGVMTILQRTIFLTSVSFSRLTAAYLAQEGIEIVRNVRDTNWLENSAWDDGLPASPPAYGVDYQTQTLPDPNCSSEGYLEFDGNFSKCSANPLAKFKRKITITKTLPDSLDVSVQVFWSEKGKPYTFSAQENLYNWR